MEYVLANNAVENIERGALNTIGIRLPRAAVNCLIDS